MSDNSIAILLLIIKCLSAILLGIVQGSGAVYFFNKIPPKWFCDYGEEPTPEMMDRYTQRVKSHPWKYVFTMAFIILNIKLVTDDWQFAIPGTIALWFLLELALGDIKFQIVPDQLLILLAITGLGFMQYHSSWKEALIGAAIGLGLMLIIAGIGSMIYKRTTLGGGDIKLYTVLGFITGPMGIIFIFITSTLISAAHFIYLIAGKKVKKNDYRPMVPYIALGAAAYIVFFWDAFSEIII